LNIPFLCVFLTFLLNYCVKIPVMMAMGKEPGGYDNRYPRDQQAKLTGWGKRAVSAHLNGFEAFPAFAAAVIMGHLAGVNASHLSILSITFLLSRIAYVGLYLANKSSLRSAVWALGFLCIGAIFVLALF